MFFPEWEMTKKITLELFLMGCMSDRFHSVRVIDQYKEILENEPKMCSFFATVTNLSRISLLMLCTPESSGLNSSLVGPHQFRVPTYPFEESLLTFLRLLRIGSSTEKFRPPSLEHRWGQEIAIFQGEVTRTGTRAPVSDTCSEIR
jgi:hypothetical protein